MGLNIKPLADRVLVEPTEAETTTASGIIIPDNAKEKPQKGEVVAAGPGRISDDGKVQKMNVKEGDIVLFDKYSGSKIRIDDEEHLIIREEDILGIIED